MEVDEANSDCWKRWFWDPYPSCRIFCGVEDNINMEIKAYLVFVVVFRGACLLWSCLWSLEFFAHFSLGRAWKGITTSMTPRPLGLLLFASLLGGLAASPLPAIPTVQGGGRAEQGQAYSLTCVVEGLPGTDTISFVWYKDDNVIKEETQQVLMFPRLTQRDAAMYQCGLMLNDRPRQLLLSEPFQLSVLVLENVTMVPEVEVEEGETAILNCSVHSVPTARLLWIMDGKILRHVESNSDSLVLHNASRFHMKVFHCQASNSEFFKILGADTQIRIKGTYEIIPKPHLRRYGLPVLHHPFKLACVLPRLPEKTAHIHLTYTWFKDYREIPGQSGEVFQYYSLTKEDRGVYTCTAKNGKPETTSPDSNEVDLLVLLPPHVHMEPATPDYVIRLTAGEELTLTCNVTEAIPWVPDDGYSWSYLPSHQGQLQHLKLNGSTLRLGPLTREDSGLYFCQARNDLEIFQGEIPPGNASVTVDVVYLKNITLTSGLEVKEGDHVILTCSVDSYPAAHLAWIVDGRVVRYVTANVDHYVLERAACSDSKMYTCHASNAELPGLERHASTNVLVVCNSTVTELPSSSPSPSSQEEEGPGSPSPPSLWLWLPWVQLWLVLITTVILLYCCNRKFREKVDITIAHLLSRRPAPDEEQPHQKRGEADLLLPHSRPAAKEEQPDQECHEKDPLQTED